MAGNTSHKIMVVLSSVRDGRHGVKVGNAVMNKLKDLPIESELLGKYRGSLFNIPNDGVQKHLTLSKY